MPVKAKGEHKDKWDVVLDDLREGRLLPKSELEKLAKLPVDPGSGVPDVEMVVPRINVTFFPVAGDDNM